MEHSFRKRRILVEGNIGCGKSTFLRFFKQLSSKTEVLHEPIYLWKDARGHDLFELMYRDSERWAVPFQAQVLVSLLDRQMKPQNAPVRLLERSIYSCRYCFVEIMHQNGCISLPDYKELTRIFGWVFKEKSVPIDLIGKLDELINTPILNQIRNVYLRSDPKICLERIQSRQRAGEEGIPLEYLQQLHDLHESWLLKGRFGSLPAPVLVFDTNAPFNELIATYRQSRDQVMCGIKDDDE